MMVFFLEEMIESCLTQTFDKWELIIVDDGSTDIITHSIQKKYSEKDPRIRIYKRSNQKKGSAVCRNIGFSKSNGKYVMHLDADDLVSNKCFSNRVSYLEQNPEIDYASFPAKQFNNSKELPKYNSKGLVFGIKKSNDLITDFLSANYSFSVWCNIYKKASIEKFKWDEKVLVYTDFSFIFTCIISGLHHSFADTCEIDYFYRTSYRKDKITNSFTNYGKANSTLYLFSKTLNELKKRDDYNFRKFEFIRFLILHYERLILNKSTKDINSYIKMCEIYYESDFINFLVSIKIRSSIKENEIDMKIIMYKLIFKHLKFKDYRKLYYKLLLKKYL